jgi:hypothetical protein
MVTASAVAAWGNKKRPEAHRPEEPEQATHLDSWLHAARVASRMVVLAMRQTAKAMRGSESPVYFEVVGKAKAT